MNGRLFFPASRRLVRFERASGDSDNHHEVEVDLRHAARRPTQPGKRKNACRIQQQQCQPLLLGKAWKYGSENISAGW